MNNQFQRRVVIRNEAPNWNDPHIQLDRNSIEGLSKTATNDGYNDSHHRYDNFEIDKPIERAISKVHDNSNYGYRNRDACNRNSDGHGFFHNHHILLANDSSKRQTVDNGRYKHDSGTQNFDNIGNQPRSVSPRTPSNSNHVHYRNYPSSSSNQSYSNRPRDKQSPFDGLDSLSKSFSGKITQRISSSTETYRHSLGQRSQPQYDRPRDGYSHHRIEEFKTSCNMRRKHQKTESPKQPMSRAPIPPRSGCSTSEPVEGALLYDDLSDEECRKLTSEPTLDVIYIDHTAAKLPLSHADSSINVEPSTPPESKNTQNKEADKEKAVPIGVYSAYQLIKTKGPVPGKSSGNKASCSSTMKSSTTISSFKNKGPSNYSKTINSSSNSDERAEKESCKPFSSALNKSKSKAPDSSSELITKESVVEAVMEIWKDGVLHVGLSEKSVKSTSVNDTIVPVPSSSLEVKAINIEDNNKNLANVKDTPDVIELAIISDSDTPSSSNPAVKTKKPKKTRKQKPMSDSKRAELRNKRFERKQAMKKAKRLLNEITVISALTPLNPPLPAPPMLPTASPMLLIAPPMFPPPMLPTAPYYPASTQLYLPFQQVVTPQYLIPNLPGVLPQEHNIPGVPPQDHTTPTSPISPPKRPRRERPAKPKVHVSKTHIFSVIDKIGDISQLKAASKVVKELSRVLPAQRDPKITWVDKESILHAMDLLAVHLDDHNTIHLRKTVLKYGYQSIHPMLIPDTINTRVDIDTPVQASPQLVKISQGRPDKLVAGGYYSCWRSNANNRNICMQKLMVSCYNNKGEPSLFSGFDPDRIVLSTNLESSFFVHPEHRVTLFQWLSKGIKQLPPQKLRNTKQGNADFVIMKVRVNKPLSGLTGLPGTLCECEFYEYNQANKGVSVNSKYPRGVDRVTTFLAENHRLTPPPPEHDPSNIIIDCD